MFIKVYQSFGSKYNAVIKGHVLQAPAIGFLKEDTKIWTNILTLLKLFRLNTIAHVPLKIHVFGKNYYLESNDNGYFELEFIPHVDIVAGWHSLKVESADNPEIEALGKIFFPYESSYGIISDIDDTVLKSYSATSIRKLYELLSKNPNQRKLFQNSVEWYRRLARSFPPGSETNAVFYVSSSEWNLYDYLKTVFKKHGLPEGIFLLNDFKSLKDLLKTGKTGHDGKLERIESLIKSFPHQKFILIGDNTQRDPYIYEEIATKFPDNVESIFIRNKKKQNSIKTQTILNKFKDTGIHTILFENTTEAIEKSIELGYIK